MEQTLVKSPTGITGFDEITRGGLPRGRTTLVCGGAGCGKTALAVEFLVRGARESGEPGLLVSFDEPADALATNFASMGFGLPALIEEGTLAVIHVDASAGQLIEAGDFTLDGLFLRIGEAIARVGAKRVALDSLDSLFAHIPGQALLRQELMRLFRWLREQGVTSVVTGERGEREMTRHGIEEYVSDCVVLLDHRVSGDISKRRVRVVKYRGSAHGSDEYPFLIGAKGLSIFPLTSMDIAEVSGTERVGTGVPDLDKMLEGKGYFVGSTILVSGTAGTGKSTLAASFAESLCKSGKSCLYFAFEESESQIRRNMRSVGIDLAPHVGRGLTVRAFRPSLHGLEEHLVSFMNAVEELRPDAVVLDPITNFISIGGTTEVKSMLTRTFNFLKSRGITTFLTSLTTASTDLEVTDARVSSLIDTWIVLDHRFDGHTRRRFLYVVKSRGMAHTLDARDLILSDSGVSIA